jgi:transposase
MFYVGVSYDPFGRLKEHIDRYGENNKKDEWKDELNARGVEVASHIVFVYPNAKSAYEAEVDLISFCTYIGIDLVNKSKGGDAPPPMHGESNPSSKLKMEQVVQIRRLFIDGESRGNLAKQFNVGLNTICGIVAYKTWKNGVEITPELMEAIQQRVLEEKSKRYENLPEPWNKGKQMSEEYCLKNSISHIGLQPSEETRRKRSMAMKGRMPKNIELLRTPEINKKRGMALSGSNNGIAKLTEDKVIELRNKHSSKQYSVKELAELFGIKECTVYDIVSRRSWKHI